MLLGIVFTPARQDREPPRTPSFLHMQIYGHCLFALQQDLSNERRIAPTSPETAAHFRFPPARPPVQQFFSPRDQPLALAKPAMPTTHDLSRTFQLFRSRRGLSRFVRRVTQKVAQQGRHCPWTLF
jgi:hypothetical protein